MATHASVLAWRIPGTGEPGGLLSVRSHRVGHDWSDAAAAAFRIEPASLASPVLAGGFFTTALPGDPITKDTRNQINPFLFQSFCCPPWFCCAALNPSLFPMNPLCAFEPIALNSVSRQSALCTQISPVRFYQNPVWMQCHPWSFFQFLLQSLFYFWTFSSSSFR